MKSFITSFLILSVVLLLNSCLSENNNQDRIIEEFDNSRIEVSVQNGYFNGVLKQFYSNGQLKVLQNWSNGEIIGDFKYFDNKGNLKLYEKIILIDTLNNRKKYEHIKGKMNDVECFDDDLITFYDKYKIIETDSIYKLGNKYSLKIFNAPQVYLLVRITNGNILRNKGHYSIRPKTNERPLKVIFSLNTTHGNINLSPYLITVVE